MSRFLQAFNDAIIATLKQGQKSYGPNNACQYTSYGPNGEEMHCAVGWAMTPDDRKKIEEAGLNERSYGDLVQDIMPDCNGSFDKSLHLDSGDVLLQFPRAWEALQVSHDDADNTVAGGGLFYYQGHEHVVSGLRFKKGFAFQVLIREEISRHLMRDTRKALLLALAL